MKRFSLMMGSLLFVFSGASVAHETKLSSSHVELSGNSISIDIEMNVRDLEVALDLDLSDDQGFPQMEFVRDSSESIGRYVRENTHLLCEESKPLIQEVGAIKIEGDHVILSIVSACSSGTLPTSYDVNLFKEVDPSSRHMVTVAGDQEFVSLLDANTSRVSFIKGDASLLDLVLKFIISGVEHIAIGFDHIAFLIAVIVLGRSFWQLVKIVTAFTIAHSLTLSLAVLDVVSMPSSIVEPLIALSIVYVALENFFVKDISRRYWITFIFGLIHGFGFASVLKDYGLPENGLVWALASFNVGVEVGQVLIVAISVLTWKLLIRLRYLGNSTYGSHRQRMFRLTVSSVVLIFGLAWFIERVFL